MPCPVSGEIVGRRCCPADVPCSFVDASPVFLRRITPPTQTFGTARCRRRMPRMRDGTVCPSSQARTTDVKADMAGPGGFEPPTLGSEGRCSIQAELQARFAGQVRSVRRLRTGATDRFTHVGLSGMRPTEEPIHNHLCIPPSSSKDPTTVGGGPSRRRGMREDGTGTPGVWN